MKRTGSEVLALTAALTASSIFRESMCLSKYSCTDIFFFFFLFHGLLRFETSGKISMNKFESEIHFPIDCILVSGSGSGSNKHIQSENDDVSLY